MYTFMHPMMFADAPTMFARPMYYRRRMSPCGFGASPCGFGASPFLFALLALMFVGPVLRLAFFFLHIAFSVFVHFAFIMICAKAVSAAASCLCDEDETCAKTESRQSACAKACAMKACFARMKEARSSCSANATVRESLDPKSSAKSKIDLSSVRFDSYTEDGARLVVAAPGVNADDLEVSFVERTLVIKGETVRGADVYCVERSILAPPQVDLSTATCTHADGVVTINLTKKASKRIPISAAKATRVEVVPAEPVEAPEEEQEEEPEAKAGESSEGEWEPLAKEE